MEWRVIEEFPNYEVSDEGQIRNKKGHILRPAINQYGYLIYPFSKEGKKHTCMIHRIVATTFIPNPNNLPQVNHKDENKVNNCVDNLEWCDCKYNANYGTKTQRMIKNRDGITKCKPVLQFDLKGNLIAEYPSIQEASRQLGVSHSNISEACKGTRVKTACGYIWQYK